MGSATALVWFLALALWLLVRRAGGALHVPLPNASLWLTAAGASVLAAAIAASLHCLVPSVGRGAHRTALAAALVAALVMLGAAVSLPASGTLGIAGAWAILSVAGCWLVTRAATTDRPDARLPSDSLVGVGWASDVPIDEVSPAPASDEVPTDVDQQWMRRRDEQGAEFIEGTARVTFAAGQRIAHLHLAICPPLGHPPQVDVEPVAGPPATVTLGAALPQGIRLDVRRLESIEAADAVLVAFFVR